MREEYTELKIREDVMRLMSILDELNKIEVLDVMHVKEEIADIIRKNNPFKSLQ